MHRWLAAVAAIFCALAPVAAAQEAPEGPRYRDARLSASERAADLVAHMTLQEKARQVQDVAPAIPRLGVPRYNWWNEGLHGVARADIATVFPQAVGMAASWNAPLLRDVGETIGVEFRAKYAETVGADGGTDRYRGLTVWSPNINIFRDPRWGRGQETFGEDPFLTSRLGVAFIHGLQGDNLAQPLVAATAKHFAVHSGPEANRHREDVHPTPYDLEDTYLPAFRATVIDGRALAVMCAYNAVNGVPACANRTLLTERLRGDWGFDGHVVSDCAAVRDIHREGDHEFVETPEQAVAIAFNAGMDLICGDYGAGEDPGGPIVRAVQQGLLSETVIDRALMRLFTLRFQLGLMDTIAQSPYASITPAQNDTEAHRELNQRMAEQSMVLLRNEGNLLPLSRAPSSIAVIGPNADDLDALLGNYNGTPSRPVTVLQGLRARFPDARIEYVPGVGLIGPPERAAADEFFCLDARCRRPGLRARTFAGGELEGPPVSDQTSANASTSWRTELTTSMRWSGWIRPTESGQHRFGFSGDSGYRIWVGDRIVADTWDVGGASSHENIDLESGRAYPIRVEARQSGRGGEQRLLWTPPSQNTDAALAAARDAELVVFVGGLSPRLEGEEMRVSAPGFSGGDRTSIDLPAPQQNLLEQLDALGKPIVLVLMSGSALGVNWADENIPAIIQAWYPGGEGGAAVARLIAGDFSPAGRLPVTFYRSADDLPGFSDYAMAGRTYRYFEGQALYPFGYGLSYTRFSYANARVDRRRVRANGQVVISVDVTNVGTRDGDEVVQLYVSHPDDAAIRSLQGFERIHLRAGQSRTVSFTVRDRGLSTVDAEGARRVRPGEVEVWIGGGQPGQRAGLAPAAGASTRFRIVGRAEQLAN